MLTEKTSVGKSRTKVRSRSVNVCALRSAEGPFCACFWFYNAIAEVMDAKCVSSLNLSDFPFSAACAKARS